MTRPVSEERETLEPCPKLREAIENGHLRCSVSVGVGSPVATIDTEDLWRLVHAAERSVSTSASERGLREALERIAAPMGVLPSWARGAERKRIALEALAALSPKGEG